MQRIKKEAGGFVVDIVVEDQAHDLLKSHLDGVGVFEEGQDQSGWRVTLAVNGKADALILKALVEETETVAAQGG